MRAHGVRGATFHRNFHRRMWECLVSHLPGAPLPLLHPLPSLTSRASLISLITPGILLFAGGHRVASSFAEKDPYVLGGVLVTKA